MPYAGQRVLSVCTGSGNGSGGSPSGNGLSCLVLAFPEVQDLPVAGPLPAKLNGTNGKGAEAKARQWKKLAAELRPSQTKNGRADRGRGPFLFCRRGTGTGRGWSADCTPVRVVWQSNHSRLRSAVVGRTTLSYTVTPYLSFLLLMYGTPSSLSLRVSNL
jgi:hypothetical protein